ncbi:MAG: DMT family transporter [bacterium]|jgi:drug/metabolite transporter (DMT)-like permease
MHIKGTILVLMSAVCFSLVSVMTKIGYKLGFTPLRIIFLEKLIASAIILPLLFCFQRQCIYLGWRRLKQILLLGLFGTVISSLAFYTALQYLDAAVATILLFTNPIVVLLLNVIINRKPFSPIQVGSLVTCLLGGVLVLDLLDLSSLSISSLGITLGFIASIGLGFFTFYAQRILDAGVHPLSIIFYNNLLILCVVFLLVLVFDSNFALGDISLKMWGLVVVLALISSILPNIFSLRGIELIGATRTSLVSTFELPCSVFFTFLFLGERLAPVQLLGALLVLLGVALVQLDKDRLLIFLPKNFAE